MQGIFGRASFATPFGRMEGCLVSPCGKPLYSRHAEVPHEAEILFSPEEDVEGFGLLGSVHWPVAATAVAVARGKEKGSPSKAGVAQWDLRGC